MSSGAEQSDCFQFIPMEAELYTHALNCGIDSGPEKVLNANDEC